jgi:predicted CoA-substrate-specific enzyme activase
VTVAGIDIGSSSAKAVIIEENEIISTALIPTGPDSADTARLVLDEARKRGSPINNIAYIVATGYGRINVPFAQKHITEISCHARGVSSIFPKVRTILDMGGQDCKAIRCDERGRVINFLMNEKCAAGTGRYLERLSATLGVSLHDIGQLSLSPVDGAVTINSYCTVFAEADVISLVREGRHLNDILAGACEALAERTQALVKRVKLVEDFSITGGIGKNLGVVKRLERNLGVKAYLAEDPQIIGALGAAWFAQELFISSQRAKYV